MSAGHGLRSGGWVANRGRTPSGSRPLPASAKPDYVPTDRVSRFGPVEVWKAMETATQEWVVISYVEGDAALLDHYSRRIAAVARLDHEYVVGVREWGIDGERLFAVRDWLEGHPLAEVCGDDRRWLAELVADAARGVHHAHERGVIHGDLTPNRLLVLPSETNPYGDVRVLDFGLAPPVETQAERVSRASAHSGGVGTATFGGSPAFMSPEQARGEELDARADVYALGAILYAIIAGEAPHATTDGERGRGEVVALTAVADDVPLDLATIVMKCLRPEAAERYESAEALAEDLERWLAGDAILARPPSVSYRARRFVRRHPVLLTAASVTAVTVLLLLAVVLPARVEAGRRAARIQDDRDRQAEETREAEAEQAQAEAEALEQVQEVGETALEAALALRRAGDPQRMQPFAERVQDAVESALRFAPRSAEPHYQLARLQRALLRDTEALEEIDEALAKNPTHAKALYEYCVLAAFRLRDQRLVYEARERARREGVQAIDERHAALLHAAFATLADERAALDRDTAALRDRLSGLQDRARSQAIDGVRATCAAGLVAWATGDAEGARTTLAVAVQTRPDLVEAQIALAQLDEEAGDIAPALERIGTVISHDAGFLRLYEVRAAIHLRSLPASAPLEQREAVYRTALADYDRSLKLDRRRADSWLGRARVWLRWAADTERAGSDPRQRIRTALAELSAALLEIQDDARLWRQRAAVRQRLGAYAESRGEAPVAQYRDALVDLSAALQLSPADLPSRIERVRARIALGRALERRRPADAGPELERAITDAGRVIRADPSRADAWRLRGEGGARLGAWLLRQSRDPSPVHLAAIDDLSTALRLAPQDTAALVARAQVRTRQAGVVHRAQSKVAAVAGDDALELADAALADARAAAGFAPGWIAPVQAEAAALGRRAEILFDATGDPFPDHDRCLATWERAVAMAPTSAALRLALGDAADLAAEHAHARGRPARPYLERALQQYSDAVRLSPTEVTPLHRRAAANLHMARWGVTEAFEQAPFQAAARQDLADACARHPNDAPSWDRRAAIVLEIARLVAAQDDDPTDFVREVWQCTEQLARLGRGIRANFYLGRLRKTYRPVLEDVLRAAGR